GGAARARHLSVGFIRKRAASARSARRACVDGSRGDGGGRRGGADGGRPPGRPDRGVGGGRGGVAPRSLAWRPARPGRAGAGGTGPERSGTTRHLRDRGSRASRV